MGSGRFQIRRGAEVRSGRWSCLVHLLVRCLVAVALLRWQVAILRVVLAWFVTWRPVVVVVQSPTGLRMALGYRTTLTARCISIPAATMPTPALIGLPILSAGTA